MVMVTLVQEEVHSLMLWNRHLHSLFKAGKTSFKHVGLYVHVQYKEHSSRIAPYWYHQHANHEQVVLL